MEVWEVFKSFGKEQIKGEEETALIFQCGVCGFTGEKLFYYDFVRQFTIEDDGHMEQLHCEFVFKPTDELTKLEASEWYFDTNGDIEDFFTEVDERKREEMILLGSQYGLMSSEVIKVSWELDRLLNNLIYLKNYSCQF